MAGASDLRGAPARRPSYVLAGSMSFRGASGDRALRTLSTNALTGKGPLTFDRVTSSQAGTHYLLKFCSNDDVSSESLLFWLEARSYAQLGAGIHRELAARKIYAKFFVDDAPMQLPLPADIIAGVTESVHSHAGPGASVFDEAVAEVSYTLRYDVFPRFLKSEHYFKLVNLTLEERMRIDVDKFDLYRLLGAGGFGMVLLVRRKLTGNYFACKVIDKRIVISQNQFHAVFREKETLASLEHPFICGLCCSFQTEHHLCLVLDFVEGGNMYSDLLDGPYTLPRAVFYAAQVVLALEYIHAHEILYRDLKPDNVLIDLRGYLKLADMGAARGTSGDGFIAAHNSASLSATKTARLRDGGETRQRRMTITGTHGYRAPEVYEREYGKAADWWNVGLLIYEMLGRENPMRGENRRESEQLTKTKDVVMPSFFTSATADIVRHFLQRDPSHRLGSPSRRGGGMVDPVQQIKDHPFFEDPVIHWGMLLELRHPVPFDMGSTSVRGTPKAPQRLLTNETNQIDYFSQTVDYMAMSIKLRKSWQLSLEEQANFDGFEYVASSMIEEELDGPWDRPRAASASRSGERSILGQAVSDQRRPSAATYPAAEGTLPTGHEQWSSMPRRSVDKGVGGGKGRG